MRVCEVCDRKIAGVGSPPRLTIQDMMVAFGTDILSIFGGKMSCGECDGELYILSDTLTRARTWREWIINPPKKRATRGKKS